TNALVPSIGSMTQWRFAPPRVAPSSSPTTPSPGKLRSTHSRAAVSAARSATVTGDPSLFVSTVRGCLKYRIAVSPVMRASSNTLSSDASALTCCSLGIRHPRRHAARAHGSLDLLDGHDALVNDAGDQ